MGASQVALVIKNPPANAGVTCFPGWGRSPAEGNGNPLQCSCQRIPWTEEPGGLQSMESQRVRHDLVTEHRAPCWSRWWSGLMREVSWVCCDIPFCENFYFAIILYSQDVAIIIHRNSTDPLSHFSPVI